MSSTVLIRSLEPAVKAKLKAQADASNRSLEAHLRDVITKAAKAELPPSSVSANNAVRRKPPVLRGNVIERGDVFSSEPSALWEPTA